MNYYIQGDAANADKIKAAFEKLGYDVTGFDMCNDNILFFTYKLQTGANVISTANANLYTASIIKTHPDYKELELPVEPKFKVGDWITNGTCKVKITDINNTYYWFSKTCILGEIESIENEYHLWTIKDAKDGDVLANGHHILILKELVYDWSSNGTPYSVKAYCGIEPNGNFEICKDNWSFCGTLHTHPATKEQRDLLFAKMREAGYEWDADKKELRKIQTHYDIANFKPFDKVLVRDNDRGKWRPSIFSYHIKGRQTCYPFCCIGNSFSQCIPFEGNEHLLGTTDMCDERFINW